jgi:hypothetical protein
MSLVKKNVISIFLFSKLLVSFIICDCESSAPFFVIYEAGREPVKKTVASGGKALKHQKSNKIKIFTGT